MIIGINVQFVFSQMSAQTFSLASCAFNVFGACIEKIEGCLKEVTHERKDLCTLK